MSPITANNNHRCQECCPIGSSIGKNVSGSVLTPAHLAKPGKLCQAKQKEARASTREPPNRNARGAPFGLRSFIPCPRAKTQGRQVRKVTGHGPSSQATARALREISPFGRNDITSSLCALASLRRWSGHALREIGFSARRSRAGSFVVRIVVAALAAVTPRCVLRA